VKTVEKQTPVAEVVRYFNEFEMETGVVVVQDEEPIGLVMRESLFRRLAFKYGYSLYWHREIAKLMDKDPLILEADTALETASRLSMARHRDQIYDLVIVTRRGKLIGAVTIRDMLNVITQEHMELARDANPLTGLPGNRRIEREIEQRIEADQPFTIIYVDLDHFKWFNDQYGFHRGDSVIVFTANVLRDCLERLGEPGDFVGHIGGDDFILITQTSDLNALCEAIISRFDHEVPQFYSHPSGNPEAHIVTDRWGNPVGSTGIAISLSVLECHDVKRSELSLERIAEEAGHLKKMAKSIQGSTSVRGSLGST
jgi:diguanylate cyclase (GGDEF)-like protein